MTSSGAPEARAVLLKEEWLPFVDSLKGEVGSSVERLAVATIPEHILPPQPMFFFWTARCSELTQLWYGQERPSYSIVYELLLKCGDLLTEGYTWAAVDVFRSEDGFVRYWDPARRLECMEAAKVDASSIYGTTASTATTLSTSDYLFLTQGEDVRTAIVDVIAAQVGKLVGVLSEVLGVSLAGQPPERLSALAAAAANASSVDELKEWWASSGASPETQSEATLPTEVGALLSTLRIPPNSIALSVLVRKGVSTGLGWDDLSPTEQYELHCLVTGSLETIAERAAGLSKSAAAGLSSLASSGGSQDGSSVSSSSLHDSGGGEMGSASGVGGAGGAVSEANAATSFAGVSLSPAACVQFQAWAISHPDSFWQGSQLDHSLLHSLQGYYAALDSLASDLIEMYSTYRYVPLQWERTLPLVGVDGEGNCHIVLEAGSAGDVRVRPTVWPTAAGHATTTVASGPRDLCPPGLTNPAGVRVLDVERAMREAALLNARSSDTAMLPGEEWHTVVHATAAVGSGGRAGHVFRAQAADWPAFQLSAHPQWSPDLLANIDIVQVGRQPAAFFVKFATRILCPELGAALQELVTTILTTPGLSDAHLTLAVLPTSAGAHSIVLVPSTETEFSLWDKFGVLGMTARPGGAENETQEDSGLETVRQEFDAHALPSTVRDVVADFLLTKYAYIDRSRRQVSYRVKEYETAVHDVWL